MPLPDESVPKPRRSLAGPEFTLRKMTIDADGVVAAVTTTLQYVDTVNERGWVAREPGMFVWCTGVELPTLNGVLVDGLATADLQVVDDWLNRLAQRRVPFCLEARPSLELAAEKIAEGRAMVRGPSIPRMALENVDLLGKALNPDGLVVHRAERRDTSLLVTVGAAGFEAPVELFRELLVEEGFSLAGMRAYLGYCDNQPVATAIGMTIDDFVGIFNVSTIRPYRNRGFGAALTARAALDGLEAGASWAWLQSTPLGRNVYRRLGFQDVEEWPCWTKIEPFQNDP
jgi:N-acetylglutamate synthase